MDKSKQNIESILNQLLKITLDKTDELFSHLSKQESHNFTDSILHDNDFNYLCNCYYKIINEGNIAKEKLNSYLKKRIKELNFYLKEKIKESTNPKIEFVANQLYFYLVFILYNSNNEIILKLLIKFTNSYLSLKKDIPPDKVIDICFSLYVVATKGCPNKDNVVYKMIFEYFNSYLNKFKLKIASVSDLTSMNKKNKPNYSDLVKKMLDIKKIIGKLDIIMEIINMIVSYSCNNYGADIKNKYLYEIYEEFYKKLDDNIVESFFFILKAIDPKNSAFAEFLRVQYDRSILENNVQFRVNFEGLSMSGLFEKSKEVPDAELSTKEIITAIIHGNITRLKNINFNKDADFDKITKILINQANTGIDRLVAYCKNNTTNSAQSNSNKSLVKPYLTSSSNNLSDIMRDLDFIFKAINILNPSMSDENKKAIKTINKYLINSVNNLGHDNPHINKIVFSYQKLLTTKIPFFYDHKNTELRSNSHTTCETKVIQNKYNSDSDKTVTDNEGYKSSSP